jgi:hypothetical protein
MSIVSLRECGEYHFKITFDCKNVVPGHIDQFIEKKIFASKDQKVMTYFVVDLMRLIDVLDVGDFLIKISQS